MSERDDIDLPSGFGLREIASIVLRWRYLLIATLILGTLAGGAVAVLIKPVYRSSASLLIQSQDIPTTVVASPLNDRAEERIAKIRQQILSRDNLQRLIDSNKLYPRERRELPADAVMAILRDAISVDLVSAADGSANQRGNDSTIAFTLAYRSSDPNASFRVTDQLTDMFVSEDNRLRSQQMAGAATFLVRRADELRDDLVALEAKRRSIEARYNGALPDQVATSAQSTSSLRAEVSRMDAESQGIMQQNGLLAARSQDVAPPPPSAAQAELTRAQAALDQLSAVYSDQHPDVIAARARLDLARTAARRDPPPRDSAAPLQAEVAAGRARIAMLAQRRASLVNQVAQVDRLVALSPQASYELNNLEREYDNLKQQYQGIREKQLDAQVALNLQAEGKGERFSVVDRATFPLKPISPQRIRLVMLGAIGGLALGVAFVLAWEVLRMPVHGPGIITRLTGEKPLVELATFRHGAAPGTSSWLDRARSWPWHRNPLQGAVRHAGDHDTR